jgi:hypothetical protein
VTPHAVIRILSDRADYLEQKIAKLQPGTEAPPYLLNEVTALNIACRALASEPLAALTRRVSQLEECVRHARQVLGAAAIRKPSVAHKIAKVDAVLAREGVNL